LKIIDSIVALLAILIGVITYSEGEKAYEIDPNQPYTYNGLDTIVNLVIYISDSQTDKYREAMIFFTFILGKSLSNSN
jgi:hypothetical protein